jgi:hypothetical protein
MATSRSIRTSQHQLYRSMRRLLDLPPQTTMYVCHDYPPPNRRPQWQTTVAQQRARNIHVRDGISEYEFVAMRNARDATLEAPTLILPSIQVNVRAGQLPPPMRTAWLTFASRSIPCLSTMEEAVECFPRSSSTAAPIALPDDYLSGGTLSGALRTFVACSTE